jgi:hypothetical protein
MCSQALCTVVAADRAAWAGSSMILWWLMLGLRRGGRASSA